MPRILAIVALILATLGLGTHAALADDCAMPGVFSDVTLQELKAQSPDFLIYIWSPYMPLSLRGRVEIPMMAKLAGIATLVPVLDQSKRICHSSSGIFADPIFASRELGALHALNHFPTYVYFHNGKIAALVHGYEIPQKFINRIKMIKQENRK